MLSKHTRMFASFHQDDESLVQSALARLNESGWANIAKPGNHAAVSELISQSDMALIFLSSNYSQNDNLMLEEFAYASVVARKQFLPVWLDSLDDIVKSHKGDRKLLSSLEMLTAKHPGATLERLGTALAEFEPDNPPYTPSTPQICEKPCEAYEGNEPYIFISYAHDDAKQVYPVVKDIFEAGWDLWYDEGIKTTERYLPAIADHVHHCAAFVLMLSNRCIERPFVMDYELEYAKKLGVPIIPVLLEKLNPPSRARKEVAELSKDIFTAEALLNRIAAENLPDRGIREAVPPAVMHNTVYDVVLPPELPGFEYAVQGNAIILTKYAGENAEVVIPSAVEAPDGKTMFNVIIGDQAFSNCEVITAVTIREGVTAIGHNAFYRCTALTAISIPASVRYIGQGAFGFCESLSDIVIPEGVTIIESGAFEECKALTAINIPKGVLSIGQNAFSGCCRLTGIIIPEGVTSIGGSAFSNCNALTEAVIPKGVTNIERGTFRFCRALINVTLPDGIESIDAEAFYACEALKGIIIPNGVKSIGKEAFCNCSSLTDISIPESVVYLASDTFRGSRVFMSGRGSADDIRKADAEQKDKQAKPRCLEIPQCKETPRALVCCAKEDVPIIKALMIEFYWEGFNIFYNDFPDPQTVRECECVLMFFSEHTSGSQAAMDNLKMAIDKDSARIIQVFLGNCIDWPDEVRGGLHGMQAIFQCLYTENAFEYEFTREFTGKIRDSLRQFKCSLDHPRSFYAKYLGDSVEIAKFNETDFPEVIVPKTFFNPPQNITSIGNNAFEKCRSLTEITLPESVNSIGAEAFTGCNSLTGINLPKNLIGIGSGAFSGCSSLTGISIPEKVEYIEDFAFRNCRSMTDVFIPDEVKLLGGEVFFGCLDLGPVLSASGKTLYHFPEESIAEMTLSIFQKNSFVKPYNIPEGVTRIVDRAFQGRKQLANIIIPDGVESIGEKAFEHCNSLTEISIPASVTYMGDGIFAYCSSLSEIVIHANIRSIGKEAFRTCISLKNIDIPDGVTSIGAGAFDYCKELTSIVIPEGVEIINSQTFCRCEALTGVTLPDDIKIIREDAFKGCSSLASIAIPKNVAGIGDGAFSGCALLSGIILPENLTYLGKSAFLNCTSLTEIIIPKNITNISDSVFGNCASLKDIIIPENVTSIGSGAFTGCKSLTGIVIPKNVTNIGGGFNGGIFPSNGAFSGCVSLAGIIIPDGVTSLGNYTFSGCTSLLRVTLPKGITSIGDHMFSGCISLTGVNIPDGVESIGEKAFFECSSLTGVVLPESVKSIDVHAFCGCKSLICIVIPENVEVIERFAFDGCTSLASIVIPESVKRIDINAISRSSNLTVYTPQGSSAWRYAEQKGLRCVPLSDLAASSGSNGIRV